MNAIDSLKDSILFLTFCVDGEFLFVRIVQFSSCTFQRLFNKDIYIERVLLPVDILFKVK